MKDALILVCVFLQPFWNRAGVAGVEEAAAQGHTEALSGAW